MELKGVQPVGLGALLGITVTSIAALIGQFIKRDTTLKSHALDDRTKLTQDTYTQLKDELIRGDRLEDQCRVLANDKTVLSNMFGTFRAEFTLINGLFDQQEANLTTEIIDLQSLRRTQILINESLVRVNIAIHDAEAFSNKRPDIEIPPKKEV